MFPHGAGPAGSRAENMTCAASGERAPLHPARLPRGRVHQDVAEFVDQIIGVGGVDGVRQRQHAADHAGAEAFQVAGGAVEAGFVHHLDGGADGAEQRLRHHRLAIERGESPAAWLMDQDLGVGSQCNNFLALRLTNETDQSVIKRLMPDSLAGLTSILPLLDTGEALMLGDAVLLPSRIKLDVPAITPNSATREFWKDWGTQAPDTNAILKAVESLRSQTRSKAP